MTAKPDRSPPAAGPIAAPVFRAQSGLAAYDQARFIGGPPAYGPLKKSDFGYAAMFQPRLRQVTEVAADASADLVIFMIMSASHTMEVWMGERFSKVDFRRGDIVIIPPGMDTRWCAAHGQASAVHLHVSAARLADATSPGALGEIRPSLGCRDAGLQRIMREAARLDELDPLVSLKTAALGAAALLQTLRTMKLQPL